MRYHRTGSHFWLANLDDIVSIGMYALPVMDLNNASELVLSQVRYRMPVADWVIGTIMSASLPVTVLKPRRAGTLDDALLCVMKVYR